MEEQSQWWEKRGSGVREVVAVVEEVIYIDVGSNKKDFNIRRILTVLENPSHPSYDFNIRRM